MLYAQLNEKGICVVVSDLSGKVESEYMIEIPVYDTSLLGKKYENGEFIEVEQAESKEDILLTENEVIMLAIADLYGEMQEIKEGLK